MRRGSVTCLFCGQTADAKYLRSEGRAGRLGQMPLAVVLAPSSASGEGRGGGQHGKTYRPVTETDRRNYAAAEAALERIQAEADEGLSLVPDEPIPRERERGNSGFRVLFYGLTHWGDLFNARQALGAEVDELMSRTGLLRKQGENVIILGPRERAKDRDLGETGPDGRPAPLIDVLHRACLLWNQGAREALAEFLAHSGYTRDESLWTVAQALSEILPEGDKEKQMLQGLLASKERVVTEVRQERLFEV